MFLIQLKMDGRVTASINKLQIVLCHCCVPFLKYIISMMQLREWEGKKKCFYVIWFRIYAQSSWQARLMFLINSNKMMSRTGLRHWTNFIKLKSTLINLITIAGNVDIIASHISPFCHLYPVLNSIY